MCLQATLQNLAVNAAGVGVFGFLLRREFNTQSAAESVVEREEDLGRLQVRFHACASLLVEHPSLVPSLSFPPSNHLSI